MSVAVETFLMPKEQFPSWEYLSVFALPRVVEGAQNRRDICSGRSCFFFWARNAIYYSLRALGISQGAHVLLPAYLCEAAVEPFEAFGAQVEFYSIGRQCSPNFAEIEAKIRARTEAVLAAHYFGFPQDIRQFRELCDRHGLALIEDCAHVLGQPANAQPLGTLGDASVFSWRKFLPIYDGGELRLNRPAGPFQVPWHNESLAFTLKVAKSLLDQALGQSPSPVAKGLSSLLEAVKKVVRRVSATPPDKPLLELDSDLATFDRLLLDQPMSRPSRWLLRHSDIPAIRSRRRQNFLFLLERLRSIPGITPLHLELPDSVCPLFFPLFFNGLANAHLPLRAKGIPAVTWGGVRPCGVDERNFPEADFLYDNLVFLPVHQNLTSGALQRIVAAVDEVSVAAPRVPGVCKSA
jgi:perosamine synthetase